jgi:hypothetical protein
MPVRHKFENKPPDVPSVAWPQGFATSSAILSTTPYEPEVIIIGSFNHGWAWNDADFFYGRGMYMWTIMANLFLSNSNVRTSVRNPVPPNNNPTRSQIFEICKKGKLCFADVVLGTNPAIPIQINSNHNPPTIQVNGHTWDSYSDSHLNIMGNNGWLDDNVENIIDFIQRTPSIKHIYFTYKSLNWLVLKRNQILAAFPQIPGCSIFTPTGMKFAPLLPAPFDRKPWSLTHCWVWNCLPNAIPVSKPGYGHLDHAWLIRNGVNPNNF